MNTHSHILLTLTLKTDRREHISPKMSAIVPTSTCRKDPRAGSATTGC
jgi:hypothetical protein